MSIIRLSIPASAPHVALARSAAASLAAHANFTIDRIDDVRLAVDEAVGLALSFAIADGAIAIELEPADSMLDLRIVTVTEKLTPPKTSTFAWTVLTALVDDVHADVADGNLFITLRVSA